MSIETTPNCKWTCNPHLFDATDHCARCGERRKDAEAERARVTVNGQPATPIPGKPGEYFVADAPPPESPAERLQRQAKEDTAAAYLIHTNSTFDPIELTATGWHDGLTIRVVNSKGDYQTKIRAGDRIRFAQGVDEFAFCWALTIGRWTAIVEKDDVRRWHSIVSGWRHHAGPANQPAPKADLEPLDFVAVRDATVARTLFEPAKIREGDRVRFPAGMRGSGRDGEDGSVSAGPTIWRVSAPDIPRVHAELSALAAESMRVEMAEAAKPTKPETAQDAVLKCYALLSDDDAGPYTIFYDLPASSGGPIVWGPDPYGRENEGAIDSKLGELICDVAAIIEEIVELRGAKLCAKDRADLDDVTDAPRTFADFRRDFGWLVAMLAREGGRV